MASHAIDRKSQRPCNVLGDPSCLLTCDCTCSSERDSVITNHIAFLVSFWRSSVRISLRGHIDQCGLPVSCFAAFVSATTRRIPLSPTRTASLSEGVSFSQPASQPSPAALGNSFFFPILLHVMISQRWPIIVDGVLTSVCSQLDVPLLM